MSMLRWAAMWFRALARRDRVESEMDREIRTHLALEMEANVRAGMSPDKAKREALVAFGGVERAKEDVRDERGTRWIENAIADVRLALRGFRRQPGFAITVALLLALGIGANAAIFSVVHRLLISPYPFPDGNRMITLMSSRGSGVSSSGGPAGFIEQWSAASRVVDDVVVLEYREHVLGDTSRLDAEPVRALGVAPGAVGYAHARPILGRDLIAADTSGSEAKVVLLTHGLWMRQFGGDSAAVGKSMLLDGTAHTVIGILPPGFALPFFYDEPELFTPARITGPEHWIEAVAKLRPGRSADEANQELRQMWAAQPETVRGDRGAPTVMRGADFVGKRMKNILLLLFAAVGVVLLIACANVANLMLARAWSRRREFAIRAAIGAGRGRLMRQILAEASLLAVFGGLIGLAVAWATLRGIIALEPSNEALTKVTLGAAVLWWSAGLSMIAALLFGTAPALFAAGGDANEAMKDGARSMTGSRLARRLRSMLVAAEVALSVMLLVGAGLLIRSIAAMQDARVAFEPRNLAAVELSFPRRAFPDAVARRALLDAVLDGVRAMAEIEAATFAGNPPPRFGFALYPTEIQGRPITPDDSLSLLSMNYVRPDFFRIAGIPIVAGRGFSENLSLTDHLSSGQLIVNESFARQFFPDGGAIGRTVRLGKHPWATITGVVPDLTYPGAPSIGRRAQFYLPQAAAPTRTHLLVRSAMDAPLVRDRVEAVVREMSPFIKVGDIVTPLDIIAQGRAQHRFMLVVLGAFAILAAVLATLGLHAVIAYAVGQRNHEVGIRMALGARAADVTGMVVGQGLRLAAFGVVFGIAGAMAGAKVLSGMLYGTSPSDPATLLSVAALMVGAAALASYLPARRAARIDPADVLRSQ